MLIILLGIIVLFTGFVIGLAETYYSILLHGTGLKWLWSISEWLMLLGLSMMMVGLLDKLINFL
jgi:hypothetical protein